MKRKVGLASILAISFSINLSAETQTIDRDKYQQLEQQIANQDYKKITSVLVNYKGDDVYENYFNDSSSEHKHDVRSASKSITAILFGIAIEQGLFQSEKDKVLAVFQDKQPIANLTSKKKAMNFEDLLMMNPPMECNDQSTVSQGNEERMYLLEDWERFALDLPNRGIPPWEKPAAQRPYGVAFSYCTAGVFLTGSAIARKAKEGLDTFAQRQLFNPLKIKNVEWTYSPLGIAQGGGGLKITSRDFMKIGKLMLNKGLHQGQRLVSEDWVNKMLSPRSLAMPDRNVEYGYLWWIFEFKHQGKTIKAFAAAGNGGNYLWVVPELELVALITSTAFNTPYMHQQSQQIFEQTILGSLL